MTGLRSAGIDLPVSVDNLLGYQVLLEILSLPRNSSQVTSLEFLGWTSSHREAQRGGYYISYLSAIEVVTLPFCLDPLIDISHVTNKLFLTQLIDKLFEYADLLMRLQITKSDG